MQHRVVVPFLGSAEPELPRVMLHSHLKVGHVQDGNHALKLVGHCMASGDGKAKNLAGDQHLVLTTYAFQATHDVERSSAGGRILR
jgi:hypothetical protein